MAPIGEARGPNFATKMEGTRPTPAPLCHLKASRTRLQPSSTRPAQSCPNPCRPSTNIHESPRRGARTAISLHPFGRVSSMRRSVPAAQHRLATREAPPTIAVHGLHQDLQMLPGSGGLCLGHEEVIRPPEGELLRPPPHALLPQQPFVELGFDLPQRWLQQTVPPRGPRPAMGLALGPLEGAVRIGKGKSRPRVVAQLWKTKTLRVPL
mmetsp:Transcript_55551/g.102790  ORF Transcript_55551/g.102790 Transcript_55551/m.102790 type:complete len:209 (-) Transcript_55551:565-1191(-)